MAYRKFKNFTLRSKTEVFGSHVEFFFFAVRTKITKPIRNGISAVTRMIQNAIIQDAEGSTDFRYSRTLVHRFSAPQSINPQATTTEAR